MPDRDFETSVSSAKNQFATTLWSVILDARDPASPDVDAALEKNTVELRLYVANAFKRLDFIGQSAAMLSSLVQRQ